jgi:4-cresol dehydrogenase (hydroxylating)
MIADSSEDRPIQSGADLRAALNEWVRALGPDRVDTNSAALGRVNRATFATDSSLVAILTPSDRNQVADCLRIASCRRVPIYPVSTGRNWGYGSAVAPRNGSVLLSLAGLDRITDHDERLGYITLEPGVTFRQLAQFLRDRGSRLLAPTTGSSPDTSVIGNILERGTGKGVYGDMAERAAGGEALLADGETIRLPAAGAGPPLLGLLPQSNFAVITELTVRLDPVPLLQQFVALYLREVGEMANCIESMRDTLQRSVGRIRLELINDYRLFAQTSRFPYDEYDGSAPLARDWIGARLGLPMRPVWIAGITIWGDSYEELALRRGTLNTALRDVGTTAHAEPAPAGEVQAADFEGLRCAYWRKRFAMPADPDPDRDRCGVVWIAPILPMRGDLVAPVVTRVEDEMLRHGFEPVISLRVVGRSIRAIIGILYDREEADADRRAIQCREALRKILDAHYLDRYRHGLLDAAPERDPATQRLLTALKRAADPHGILSPGRYGLE